MQQVRLLYSGLFCRGFLCMFCGSVLCRRLRFGRRDLHRKRAGGIPQGALIVIHPVGSGHRFNQLLWIRHDGW